jgi:GAF domain-containing protein
MRIRRQKGKTRFSSNPLKDLQCILESCRKGGIISLVALPLKAYDKPLGVLGIGRKHERSFDKEEQRFFETLAGEVALAWENALLYQDIHHHAQELEEKVSQRTRELQERVKAEKR